MDTAPSFRICESVMGITTLGEARYPSPLRHFVSDHARVLLNAVTDPAAAPAEELLLELAGPREMLFFNPQTTRARGDGIIPGTGAVIRPENCGKTLEKAGNFGTGTPV